MTAVSLPSPDTHPDPRPGAFVILITHKSRPSTWSWRPVGATRSRVTGLASREAAVDSLEAAGFRLVNRP